MGWGYGKGLNSVPEQFKGGNLIEIKWGGVIKLGMESKGFIKGDFKVWFMGRMGKIIILA